MANLLLASASPRRKELLTQIGISYESASMDINETVKQGELPKNYVLRLAKEKAQAGIALYPDKVVLAADTTVVVDGVILGKPGSTEEAFNMLKHLSGTVHDVLTGVAIARQVNGKLIVNAECVMTKVTFSQLSDYQIEQYIKTKEPMGKAGAYGIQGKAALFVEYIEGSYSNVVGLPLAETGKLLEASGISFWQ